MIDKSLVTLGYLVIGLYFLFFDMYLNISVMFISQIYVSSATSKLFNICFFTFPKCYNFLITYHIVYCLPCM